MVLMIIAYIPPTLHTKQSQIHFLYLHWQHIHSLRPTKHRRKSEMRTCAKVCCGIWIVFLGIFWLLWVVSSVKKVQYYYAYPVSTSISEMDVGQPLGMPIVTLCNLNPVRLSAFTSSDLYNAGQMYGILTSGLELVTSLADSNDLKAKVNFSDEDKREPFDLEEFQKRAGHQFEEVLKYCNYAGKTCFSSDFKPIVTEMGLCHQFNWNEKGKPAYNRGPGLQLYLDAQKDDYLPPNTKDLYASNNAGYKILVHDQRVPPIVEDFGTEASVGLKTNIGLEEEEVRSMPAPYGFCLGDSNGGETRIRNYTEYSAEACTVECKAHYIMEECACRMPYMPYLSFLGSKNSICSPQKVESCVKNQLDRLNNDSACGGFMQCPKACMLIKFKTSVSVTPLVDSADILSSKVAAVSIRFRNTGTRKSYEYPQYTLSSLMSDIGSPFCLLLGASVWTIMEIRRSRNGGSKE